MRKIYSDFISGYTCKGLAHKKLRKPNQDYVFVRSSGGITLICVADGVGSHKYSHKGSKQICRCVFNSLKALKKG